MKRLKILVSVFAVSLLVCSSQSVASEKYTANECFEGFSRAIVKMNNGLEKAIFKPIAKGYRALPAPIRKGTAHIIKENKPVVVPITIDRFRRSFDKTGFFFFRS